MHKLWYSEAWPRAPSARCWLRGQSSVGWDRWLAADTAAGVLSIIAAHSGVAAAMNYGNTQNIFSLSYWIEWMRRVVLTHTWHGVGPALTWSSVTFSFPKKDKIWVELKLKSCLKLHFKSLEAADSAVNLPESWSELHISKLYPQYFAAKWQGLFQIINT